MTMTPADEALLYAMNKTIDETYFGPMDMPDAVAYLAEKGYYLAPIVPATTTPSRSSDPRTSHEAERRLSPVAAGTHRHALLAAFHDLVDATDEEAMEQAEGVSPLSEYAKRCSELRAAGLIRDAGTERAGSSGVPRIVSEITAMGEAELRRLAQ